MEDILEGSTPLCLSAKLGFIRGLCMDRDPSGSFLTPQWACGLCAVKGKRFHSVFSCNNGFRPPGPMAVCRNLLPTRLPRPVHGWALQMSEVEVMDAVTVRYAPC